MRFPLKLFKGYGLELEYMIVDRTTLNVKPITDKILATVAGETVNEWADGEIAWSNELVNHVLEFKTNGPSPTLSGLSSLFQKQVQRANQLLEFFNAMLLPTGMHPWMNPKIETQLWKHDNKEVYNAYDRIFGCHHHGWANIQSTQINLPFGSELEFVRLNTAIRIVTALTPSLAASTPLMDGVLTGLSDTRLSVYHENQKIIPSITGDIIPEVVNSIDEYFDLVLKPMYKAIKYYDRDNILQHEWLNSRGAIARFERGAIEMRLMDSQECPLAEIAVCAALVAAVKALSEERWVSLKTLQRVSLESLQETLQAGIQKGSWAMIDDPLLLRVFGFSGKRRMRSGDLWDHLIRVLLGTDITKEGWNKALRTIILEGTLAQRMVKTLGKNPDRQKIKILYQELAHCLQYGELYHPKPEIEEESQIEEVADAL